MFTVMKICIGKFDIQISLIVQLETVSANLCIFRGFAF